MAIFDDITLSIGDQSYKIPADRVLGAIARIEEVITFQELCIARERGTISLSLLSQAYGSVLRYAGAKVTNDEVYAEMWNGNGQEVLVTALTTLLLMMVPKSVRLGEPQKGKAPAARGKRPSRRSTNSRSQKASGSLQSSSGA